MQRVNTKHDCLFRVFTIYNFLCAQTWFICTHRINRPISDIMSKLEPQPNQTNTFITFSQQRIGSALAFTQSGKGLHCKLLWQLKKQCALVWTATYLNKLLSRCPGWSKLVLSCNGSIIALPLDLSMWAKLLKHI